MKIKDFWIGKDKYEIRIGYFKPDILAEAFHLPENLEPISILAIGYTDKEPADPERHVKTRIPVAELVSCESYKKQ